MSLLEERRKARHGVRLIAHRGNISGPHSHLENTFDYIEAAIGQGYEVEIDVWFEDGKYLLGHDRGVQEIINCEWFRHPGLWCHAKNPEALHQLLEIGANAFWHEGKDVMTVTGHGFIWALANAPGTKRSIAVLPETFKPCSVSHFGGVCSDYVSEYLYLRNL